MTQAIPGAEYRAIAHKHYPRRCVVCGAVNPLEVHHKNGNHADNRPGNLEWRCRAHHLQAHGKRVRTPFTIEFPTLAQAEAALPLLRGTGMWYRLPGEPTRRRRAHGCGTTALVLLLVMLGVLM